MSNEREQPDAIRRAITDRAGGRQWTAANRLQSFLSTEPLHGEARQLLGEILLEMGATVDAGAVVIASERDDPAALAAIEAWLAEVAESPMAAFERMRGQGFLVPGVVDEFGPIARSRLTPLVERAVAELGADESAEGPEPGELGLGGRAALTGLGVGCGAIVAVFLVGVVQVARWVFGS